jgi:hypothetical protein
MQPSKPNRSLVDEKAKRELAPEAITEQRTFIRGVLEHYALVKRRRRARVLLRRKSR